MDEHELRLDGNTLSGVLGELFAAEMTTAQIRCSTCDLVAELATHILYMYPRSPGGVLRCRGCEAALMVVVHRDGRLRLGLPGVTWLEVGQPGDQRQSRGGGGSSGSGIRTGAAGGDA